MSLHKTIKKRSLKLFKTNGETIWSEISISAIVDIIHYCIIMSLICLYFMFFMLQVKILKLLWKQFGIIIFEHILQHNQFCCSNIFILLSKIFCEGLSVCYLLLYC